MDVYLTLLKLFAVLIGLMFIFYALAAVVVAVALGTLETLRQIWELEEKAQDQVAGEGYTSERLKEDHSKSTLEEFIALRRVVPDYRTEEERAQEPHDIEHDIKEHDIKKACSERPF